MTKREVELERIKEEADKFFEYPTSDKIYVSTNSMIFFVEFMLEKAKND